MQEITALADAAKAKLEEIQTRIEELNSGISSMDCSSFSRTSAIRSYSSRMPS